MSKNILITNDDGINADGLLRLAKAAQKYGDIWIIAPDSERSAASHSLTIRHSIDVYPVDHPIAGISAFSCSGTPADCVRLGSISIMPKRPDIVLSGINFGYNSATDLQYSATAGAAFEAAFQGIPAIALSECANGCHETTDAFLDELLERYIDIELSYGHILNINFPGCSISDCKGILDNRTVSRGMFYRDNYKLVENLENGGMRYKIDGIYNEDCEPGTDFEAIVNGYVSVGTVSNIGV